MSKNKKASAVSAVEIILIILLVAVIAVMVFVGVVFHKDNTATSIFGYSFYRTRAVNMEPNIPQNTVIIAKKSEISSITEGSVILCKIGEYTALIRVTQVQDGAYIVKFDAAPENETARVESSSVIAKAVWQFEAFGKFLDFATSTAGIIIMLIIPLSIIIIVQIVRINRLRELEKEASSIDDIDEIISSRQKKNEPDVVLSKPKPNERDENKPEMRKEPPESPLVIRRPVNRSFDFDGDDYRPKARLVVDSNGKADFTVTEDKPVSENETPNERLERIIGMQKQTPAIDDSARASSGNEPAFATATATRINADRSADELGGEVRFTPHITNVIPDSLANIQSEAAQRSDSDSVVRNYFEKNEKPAEAPAEKPSAPTIPDNAVIPKENIAPVRKKKSSKTLEELMSIIDAEETKLKK